VLLGAHGYTIGFGDNITISPSPNENRYHNITPKEPLMFILIVAILAFGLGLVCFALLAAAERES